jgi:hypothetical protein
MSPPPSLPPPPPLLSASALASARLGGKLTADLVMRSPQYMNCLGDYEIDLRGKKVERRTRLMGSKDFADDFFFGTASHRCSFPLSS